MKDFFDSIVMYIVDRKRKRQWSILVHVVLYIVLSVVLMLISRNQGTFLVFGHEIPTSTFMGVFSVLSNILLIMMVLYYKKLGLFAAILLLILQFPSYMIGFFFRHNHAQLPGFFSYIAAFMMIIIIYRSHKKIENENEKMQRLFEQTVATLVNAIDAKDKYTHGHSSRVAAYSRKLAQMKGKSEAECNNVYIAGLLHDVGKIGIPISIISKTGKLTDEEYDTIKQHPVTGANILQNITEYPFLSIGARYHHERYDGKGYPEGLKATDIPELARIIAVADAYDAMTSKRSYRDPLPQERVREEYVKCAGTQFDPEYAKFMIQLIDLDDDYMMKELDEIWELDGKNELAIGHARSAASEGVRVTANMVTFRLTVKPHEDYPGSIPSPSLILFDSLDRRVHTEEKDYKDLVYYEFAEIRFDGTVEHNGVRKIETHVSPASGEEKTEKGEYRIDAVRNKDHVLLRIFGKDKRTEVILALPDSSRYSFLALSGQYCRISDVRMTTADQPTPADYIPRIAEEVNFIHGPEGDLPNVQIDGFRSAASKGFLIRDGLTVTFHTEGIPTSRLIWHCPFVDIFTLKNGKGDGEVNGEGYSDLVFLRFDGECCETNETIQTNSSVHLADDFGGWNAWKEANKAGYDCEVHFRVSGNVITVTTSNQGISLKMELTVSEGTAPIYGAVTGDQCVITNIHLKSGV